MSPEQDDGVSYEGDDIADADKEPCYLLEIAPELRNRIYEYVLIGKKRLQIDESLRPPAILHTCRQIKSEATKLWLTRNRFAVHIRNCDASLLKAFQDVHEDAIHELWESDHHLSMKYTFSGSNNWNNLMRWCEAVHGGKMESRGHRKRNGPSKTTIIAALRLAKRARQLDWTHCQILLEELRPVAAIFDKSWLKDSETTNDGMGDFFGIFD